MVKAILEGRKTQTRRVIKPQPVSDFAAGMNIGKIFASCPYGQIRSRLWVRETWRTEELDQDGLDGIRYQADNGFQAIENTVAASDAWIETDFRGLGKWRPSIHMPRWASRITLEITGVRVERLVDITLDDAKAEGIGAFTFARGAIADNPPDPRWKFIELWNSINQKRGYGWDTNCWVWVLSFKRMTP